MVESARRLPNYPPRTTFPDGRPNGWPITKKGCGPPRTRPIPTPTGVLGTVVRELNPVYFALMMVTGIVSIAAHRLGMRTTGLALLAINVLAYAALAVLTAARVLWYPRVFLDDVINYDHGVGLLTIVAGTCVLGSQFVVLCGRNGVATLLWIVGCVLWVVLTHGVFAGITVQDSNEFLAEGIHGGWLLLIVATQSVSVLGGLLVPSFSGMKREVLFFTLSMYLIGGMLYFVVITLVFYRLTFFAFDPESARPPYWINMGAVAITTLVSNAPRWGFLNGLGPFLEGLRSFPGSSERGGCPCS